MEANWHLAEPADPGRFVRETVSQTVYSLENGLVGGISQRLQ